MTTIYSMEYSQADDDAGNGELNGELNGEFNSAQKATLNYIKENAGCNATEISDKTGVPFSTIWMQEERWLSQYNVPEAVDLSESIKMVNLKSSITR